MRLAVAFWDAASPAALPRMIERMDAIGVKGVTLVTEEGGWPAAELQQARKALEAKGMFVAELACMSFSTLTSPDAKVRGQGIEWALQGVNTAHALDAHTVAVHWSDQGAEDWWSDQTGKLLVEGIGKVAVEAERLGVDLGFHSFHLAPWDSPEQHRKLADDVGSPRVKVLFDPVNMMTSRRVGNTTDFLNHSFDLLGDLIVGTHAKDVSLDASHWVVKLDEVPPGTGSLDYETYLRRVSQLDPATVVTIEHLRDVGVSGSNASPDVVYYQTDSETTRAKDHILEVAQKIGVEFD